MQAGQLNLYTSNFPNDFLIDPRSIVNNETGLGESDMSNLNVKAGEFNKRVEGLSQHIAGVLIEKHAGYGASGLNSPMLAPQINPIDALLVRMSDKFSRLNSLRNLNKTQGAQFEALKDTCLDIVGYSMLLYMGVEDYV